MAQTKRVVSAIITLVVVAVVCTSCSWHPRWHSVYGKKPNVHHEYYDPYKLKWYRKAWKNGSI